MHILQQSEAIIKWWTINIKIDNKKIKRYELDTNKLLEIISPEDRERAFQEVIGGKFKHHLRWDYAGAREYCWHQREYIYNTTQQIIQQITQQIIK